MEPATVDKDRIYNDVKRLLFEDCKDTTVWDHLGNLEPVRQPQQRHVKFVETRNRVELALERIDLPPGLGLLYAVRAAQDPPRSSLLRLLRIAALPPPPDDHCVKLYEAGMARLARLRAEEEERIRLAKEAEDRECTFQPVVSETSKGDHTKESLDKFFERSVDWEKNKRKKIEAKRRKEQLEREEEEKEAVFEMSERSKKLAERYRQKKAEQDATPQRKTRVLDGYVNPSFMPITNSASRIEEYFFKNATGSGRRSRSGGDGDDEGGADGGNSEGPRDGAVTTASMIVQRLEEDTAARRKRQEERHKLFLRKQKERLYDKVTGQPLFTPNAMPLIERKDGTRVPYAELSAAEKAEYHKRLRSHHVDVIPQVATRRDNKATRDIDAVVRDMTEKQREASKAIARIKRKDEQELTKLFHPTIESKSAEIASSNEHRQPVYKLPLPKRQPSPKEKKPLLAPSNGESIESMLNRTEQWKQQFQSRFERKKKEIESAETKPCTFKPKVNRASESLVAAAESRYAAEVAQEVQSRSPSSLYYPQQPQSQPQSATYRSPSFKQPTTPLSASTHGSMSKRPRSTPHATLVIDDIPYVTESATAAEVPARHADPTLDDLLSSWKDLDRLTDAALGL